MSSAITGKEMAAIPPKDRVYTCQQCGKVSMENEQFRLIQFLGIAFVICFDCILGDQKAELERTAASKALTDLASKIEATSKRTDNTFTEHAVVEAGGLELLQEAAEAYRQERKDDGD